VSTSGIMAAGRLWRKVTLPDESEYFYCPDTYETCHELPEESLSGPPESWVRC